MIALMICVEHFRQSPNSRETEKEATPGIVRWTRIHEDGVKGEIRRRGRAWQLLIVIM